MELLEAIATTRSIRRYRPEPVPDAALAAILWAASRAPSGSNRQPFRFLVLRDGERAAAAKALLGEAARAAWASKHRHDGYAEGTGADAGSPKARMARTMDHYVDRFEEIPVVVLACLVRYRAPHPAEGASIYPAVQNLLLAARDLGYGGAVAMWHTACEPQLRSLLGLPDGTAISATITLGSRLATTGRCAAARWPSWSSRTVGARHRPGRSIRRAPGSRAARRVSEV